MAGKQNKYINVELDHAERQLKSWMAYLDANPYEQAKDRIDWKEMKNGGLMPIKVATIETVQKNLRDTLREYLGLLEVVKILREKEEVRSNQTYGNVQESLRMRNTQTQKDDE